MTKHPGPVQPREVAPFRISSKIEITYFALMMYGILGVGYGVDISLLAAGGLGFLTVYCVTRLGGPFSPVFKVLRLPIGCAISFVIVQVLFHGESIIADANRAFITWIFALIVIKSLWLREDFFHHAALAIFITGLLALPFLDFSYGGSAGA